MANKHRSMKIRLLVFCCFLLVLFAVFYKDLTTALIPNSPLVTISISSLLFSPVLSIPISTTTNRSREFSFNSTSTEGFVTFSDNNPKYLALLINLLDSVHYFSTRPIIAYGIDVDLNVDTNKYPRLIKRRLKRTLCGPSIYFCKIYAIVESKLDYGVHLEADSVVNWNVDILFDVVHRWPYALPLAPRHPGDPVNYKSFLQKFHLNLQSRTTPYVHAQFSWNYRAYPFFRRALDLMRQGNFMDANYDETGINVLLWEAKANHTLCKIDPYYAYLSSYELQNKTCKEFCHTAFILPHGSKNPAEMRGIFERLKKHTGSPFVQTIQDGFHYLNETQYTCCYPDSKPSPIHPLLCQHTT